MLSGALKYVIIALSILWIVTSPITIFVLIALAILSKYRRPDTYKSDVNPTEGDRKPDDTK